MEGTTTLANVPNNKLHIEVIEKVKQSLKCGMPLCDRFPRPNEDTYRCGSCFSVVCQVNQKKCIQKYTETLFGLLIWYVLCIFQVCYVSNAGQLKSCTCTNATLHSDPVAKLFISAFNYYPCKYHYNGCKTEPLVESLPR